MTEYEKDIRFGQGSQGGFGSQAPQARPMAAPGQQAGPQEPITAQRQYAPPPRGRLSKPIIMTAIILGGGIVFSFAIASLFSGGEPDSTPPVVQADAGPVKVAPDNPGGLDIPHQDSTVFSLVEGGEVQNNGAIENLLDQDQPQEPQQVASAQGSLSDFAKEAEDLMKAAEDSKDIPQNSALNTSTPDAQETVQAPEVIASAAQEVPTPSAVPTSEKTDPGTKPEQLHAAGSSPETLAFVRSVLDKKDATKTAPATNTASLDAAARVAAQTEPAAGSDIPAGGYYIQLGSVTSPDGAEKEWGKIQQNFATQLGGMSHRVQEANLGERGTFYRIQAGPTTKDVAAQICNDIKAQKPGACLVVQ